MDLRVSSLLILIAITVACAGAGEVTKTEDWKGKQVFVIGDIHGQLGALKKLLSAAKVMSGSKVKSGYVVVAAGDMISRGDSVGVLKHMMSIGAKAVRGNHERSAVANGRSWFSSCKSCKDYITRIPDTIKLKSHKNAIICHLCKTKGGYRYIGHYGSSSYKKTSTQIMLDTRCWRKESKSKLTGVFIKSDGKPGKIVQVSCK